MNEIPLFRSLIGKWCLRYPPDENAIPQKFKDHSGMVCALARVLALVGFFTTGGNIWTWMIWFPIIFVFNTDDCYKVYEEIWEIRTKKKLTLGQTFSKIAGILIDDQIKKIEQRRGKK